MLGSERRIRFPTTRTTTKKSVGSSSSFDRVESGTVRFLSLMLAVLRVCLPLVEQVLELKF